MGEVVGGIKQGTSEMAKMCRWLGHSDVGRMMERSGERDGTDVDQWWI